MLYDVRTNISSAATQMIHFHIIFPSLSRGDYLDRIKRNTEKEAF